MNVVVCPHCKSHRIVTARVPKDVIVVMSCPSCNELVVLYKRKVIAIDRHTLEEGSLAEKKEHIAEVIAEFLESGVFGFMPGRNAPDDEPITGLDADDAALDADTDHEGDRALPPISERELAEFSRIQLERLDDAAYFRKHFG
jgi:hypothetical protein